MYTQNCRPYCTAAKNLFPPTGDTTTNSLYRRAKIRCYNADGMIDVMVKCVRYNV